MRYAVIINLDYENYPVTVLQIIWQEITEAMVNAGFREEGRLFTIRLPEKEAGPLAMRIIDELEAHLEFHQKHLHRYIKDFFGFEMVATRNLMVPSGDAILVEDVQI
jgi:hypothetical protein